MRGSSDAECFVEAVQACEPETFHTQAPVGTGAEGVYRVVGPAGPACEVSFEYSKNPNPTFVDRPVTFILPPEDATEDGVLGALEACMTGRTGKYQCAGPLFDQLAGAAPGYASLDYGGDGPLPCGTPVEVADEPLYPMSKDGKWGYVTRDGDWKIPPQWERAGDFHEGRAIVGGRNAWGIIDRDGKDIIEQEHASAVDGQAPFTPYSEGCTVANIFTDTSQPRAAPFSDGLAQVWTDTFDIAFMDSNDFAFHDVTVPAAEAGAPVRAKINAAGAFHDGLAPVVAEHDGITEFAYMNQQGEVAFVPDRLEGIALCDARLRPEFRNGLVRLVVADNGESCSNQEGYLDGAPTYDAAHYVYLDTQGRVALRQVK